MDSIIVLLAPEHGTIQQYLTRSGIENPQVRELNPRAGMRCYEVSVVGKTDGLIEQVLSLIRTVCLP